MRGGGFWGNRSVDPTTWCRLFPIRGQGIVAESNLRNQDPMDTRSYAFLFAALAAGVSHGQDIRSATADNLNLPGAWNDGSAPVAADTATWNAASTLSNTPVSYTHLTLPTICSV